ncbi:uncharacterized protein B0I36DRAFT_355091 [Microdochium trichocladiopsis]|uniref:Uncharacterized protein n=1 Tax=Microdochium trichocladiopsis TaxID=1682393 RepID=A0A9P8XUP6_9PEZI|nr:uncharacterized protein B0I36DRAFT_355091 [Microdochium trichocladiopsis]KAH7016274.1 hypothetical protein B0I36DRAFT_355091 [Microdochium trichocladiopsis]
MAQRSSKHRPRPARFLKVIEDIVENLDSVIALLVNTRQQLLDLHDGDDDSDFADEDGIQGEKHNCDDTNMDRSVEVNTASQLLCKTEHSPEAPFFCPEDECKGRKADKTWKEFARHYEIHVPCQIQCSMCETTPRHVASLRRHFTECRELKRKRKLPEHEGEIEEMKRQKEGASRKASNKAREVMRTCTQSLSEPSSPESRKKPKLQTPTLASTESSKELSPFHTADETYLPSPIRSCVGDASENSEILQSMALGSDPLVVSTAEKINDINNGRFSSANGAVTEGGILEFTDPTALFPSANQNSIAQGTTSPIGVSNHLESPRDESAVARHGQMLSVQDSSSFLTKALSFELYAMDGMAGLAHGTVGAESIYRLDERYLEIGITAFEQMGASELHSADQFRIQENHQPWLD